VVQIGARFPEEVRRRLKSAAARAGESVQDFITRAVLEYLEDSGEDMAEVRKMMDMPVESPKQVAKPAPTEPKLPFSKGKQKKSKAV